MHSYGWVGHCGLGILCVLLSDRTSSAHSSVAPRIVLFLLYVTFKKIKKSNALIYSTCQSIEYSHIKRFRTITKNNLGGMLHIAY